MGYGLRISWKSLCTAAFALMSAASVSAQTCVENGGTDVCSKMSVSAWSGFFLCTGVANDGQANCLAAGGTYNDNGSTSWCTGASPYTASNLVARANNFHHCPVVSDTGFGQVPGTPLLCNSGTPVDEHKIRVADYRDLGAMCPNDTAPRLMHTGRNRNLYCPKSTFQTPGPSNGESVCIIPLANCPSNNPVFAQGGRKIQIDDDGSFEGFRLSRHYSSNGSSHQYDADLGADPVDPVWRFSFDIRIEPIAGSTYAIAALSTPDGELQYFRPDGTAILGSDSRTYRLTTGSWGYRVVSPDAVMTFNTQGRMTGWQRLGGRLLTFRYADGTLGAGGQTAFSDSAVAETLPVPNGQLIEIQSPTGRSLRIDRDSSGRVTQIMTRGANDQVRYVYGIYSLDRVLYRDGGQRHYFYNESAYTTNTGPDVQLTGIADTAADGLEHRFAIYRYNSDGRAVSTEHAGGTDIHGYSYDAPYGQTTTTDPLGQARTLTFAYAKGVYKLATQSQPAGAGCSASTSSQTYDANGNVASTDDFNGTRSCYANDLARNVETARVDGLSTAQACSTVIVANATLPANSRKTSTQWHPDWKVVTKVASPGRIVTSVYNGQSDPFNGGAVASCAPATALLPDGKPIAVLCKRVEQSTTDADGHLGFGAALQSGVATRVSTWTYDALGQVLTAKGPRTDLNSTTTSTYYTDTTVDHTLGDLKTITNAAGKVTTFNKYSKQGKVLQSTDPNGIVTVYTYDARQRLLTSTVGSEVTAYAYDPLGQLVQVTQADGSWVGYEYDDAHRQKAVKDNLGNRIEYQLDNAGSRTGESAKDPTGSLKRSLARVMDALGRIQQNTGRE